MKEDRKPRPVPLELDDDDIEIVEVIGFEDDRPGAAVDETDPHEIVVDFDGAEDGVDGEEGDGGAAPATDDTVPRETFIRLQADFENFKKRTERERRDFEARATAALVERLLAVIDNFERALVAGPAGSAGSDEAFAEGVGLIYRQLMDELAKEGLSPVDALGETFDPTRHEAVATEVVDGERAGTVLEVFQRGYRFEDRLLRPALVKVGVDGASATAGGSETDERERRAATGED